MLLLFSSAVVCSVMPSSLWPQGLQHARLHCPSVFTRSFVQLMFIELIVPPNHLILCHPLLLLPSVFPSIRVFSNESALCIRWPKYWSFSTSASVLLMNIQDWFPLGLTGWISLQSGLSRLQHYSLKASILRHSAFFIFQLSHPYMTTGKTITLTIQIFVGKMMSLLFNTLSRFHCFYSKEQMFFNLLFNLQQEAL